MTEKLVAVSPPSRKSKREPVGDTPECRGQVRDTLWAVSLRSLFLIVTASALTLTACSGGSASDSAPAAVPEAFGDQGADGETLANAWFEFLASTGSPEGTVEVSPEDAVAAAALTKPYLDPAFQLQRATGQRYTREDYIPSDIDAFRVSNVSVTEPREDLKVIRYAVQTTAATVPDAGLVMSDVLAPRLTLMRWDAEQGHWVIVSHANFNTPVQAVCDQEPIEMTSEEVTTSEADRKLGEELVRKWFDLLIAGDGSPLLHPQVQGQSATGAGYTTAAEYPGAKIEAAELSDFIVTRNRDLLVVSHGVDAQGSAWGGSMPLSTNKTPRLHTFLEDQQGEWKLVSTAVFNPATGLPDDADCA